MPTVPARFDPEDGSEPKAADDQMPAEPAHTKPIARTRMLAGGFIARHPTVLRVLEWLGWNNPGGSINP